jgi:GTPase SAR1 family protein
MKCLLEYILYKEIQLSQETLKRAQILIQNTANVWSTDIGINIKLLWSDKNIRNAYNQHDSRFLINDTAQYFFDNLDRINSVDFQPTIDDILRVRVRSQGIEEAEFIFDKRTFKFVDVGGQRSQRRKWIHCFDDVSAVLYCSSLTEYDLALREDPRINRLEDSRALFTEVCHQPSFQDRLIIFFLNKIDLFREKLPRSPLEAHQSGYTAPAEDIEHNLEAHVTAASEYIKELFLSAIDQNQRNILSIFVHFTCALDTHQIEIIIRVVRKQLLEDVINELGMKF